MAYFISGSSTSTGSFAKLGVGINHTDLHMSGLKQINVKAGYVNISGNGGFTFNDNTSTGYFYASNVATIGSGNNIQFKTYPGSGAYLERMRILADGNVGIGTASPSGKLHIQSGSVSGFDSHADDELILESSGAPVAINIGTDTDQTAYLMFSDSTRHMGSVAYYHSDNSMAFRVNSATALAINSSGDIYSNTANAKISGSSTSTGSFGHLEILDNIKLKSGANTDGWVFSSGYAVGFLDEGGHYTIKAQNNTGVYFATNNGSQKMQILNSGNVSIGNTNDTYKLDVSGTGRFTGTLTTAAITTTGITSTGDIRATGDVIAENYIVSSSVTYMTQSFSSGSTIFGDSSADTHQFTGSVSITGSSPGLTIDGAILSPARINFNHTGSNLWSLTSRAQSDAAGYGSNANNRLAFYEGSNSTPVLQMKGNYVAINRARNQLIDYPLTVGGSAVFKSGKVLIDANSDYGVFDSGNGIWGYRPRNGANNSVLVVGTTSGTPTPTYLEALTLYHTTGHAKFGGNIGVGAKPPSLSSAFPSGSLYAVGNISGSASSTGSFSQVRAIGKMVIGAGGSYSPVATLEIIHDGTDPALILDHSGYGTRFGGDATGFFLYHNTTSRNISFGCNSSRTDLVIKNGGLIGFGTAAPITALDIHSAGTEVAAVFGMADDGTVWVSTRTAETQNNYGAYAFMVGSAAVDGVSSTNTTAYINSTVKNSGGSLEGDLAFYTNAGDSLSTAKMIIDKDGKVGIGIASPLDVLHVVGDDDEGALGSADANNVAVFQNNYNASDSVYATLIGGTTGYAGLHFGDKDDSDAGVLRYDLYAGDGGGGFQFWTEGTQRMEILSGGNVVFNGANQKISGSATSTGSFGNMFVANDIQFGTRMFIQNEGTGLRFSYGTNYSKVTFGDADGAEPAITIGHSIMGAGNNGISGSASSTGSFGMVKVATDAPAIQVHGASQTRYQYMAQNVHAFENAGGVIRTVGSTALVLQTNSTSRMTIDGAVGNVGIGTASPATPARLHVVSSSVSGRSDNAGTVAILERAGHAYLQISTNNSSYGGVLFGDDGDSARGMIAYDHSADKLYLRSAGTSHFSMDSSGHIYHQGNISGSATSTGSFGAAHIMGVGASSIALGVGTSAPASTLHMKAGAPELRIESTGTDDASRLRLINDAGGDWYVGAGAMDGSSNFQAVKTNATTGLNITTAGKVGIGTTRPSGSVHIQTANGSAYQAGAGADDLIVENNGDAGITITGPDANTQKISFGSTSTDVHASITAGFDGDLMSVGTSNVGADLRFLTGNNSEAVRILDSGNVGIGETSPDTLLHLKAATTPTILIEDSTNAAYSSSFQQNDNDLIIKNAADGAMRFNHNGSERLTIAHTGNVGINDTTPSYKLDVDGTGRFTGNLRTDGEFHLGGHAVAKLNGSVVEIGNPDGNSVTTKIHGFDGSGYLLVGENLITADDASIVGITGTYGAPAFQLGSANDGFYHGASASTQTGAGINVLVNNVQEFLFADGGVFHADDDIVAFSGNTASDIRLKTNIQPISGSLNKLEQLRPVEFDWLVDRDNHEYGFIAQEVEKVVPEIVSEHDAIGGTKEFLKNLDGIETFKTIEYSKLTVLLVDAMKEQQEQINELKTEIQELKNGLSQ